MTFDCCFYEIFRNEICMHKNYFVTLQSKRKNAKILKGTRLTYAENLNM